MSQSALPERVAARRLADHLGADQATCGAGAHSSVAVMARLTCTACGGFHSVQKCPELWSELRADPALGAQLMSLWWKKHTSFVAMLINADAARRRHYAYSWVAYIRTYNPATTLTAYRMLARWAHEMDPEPTPVAMELAA
jgi:hypothetical protein